jgi:hypothetical protein
VSAASERAPRLEELPSVLDASETRAVLRIGESKLRELLAAGRLQRLAYSATILIDSREIRRFLRDETGRDQGAAA